MAYFGGKVNCRPYRRQVFPVVKGSAEPTREEIARLAYSYWEARGRCGDSAVEDWLRAERELWRSRYPMGTE